MKQKLFSIFCCLLLSAGSAFAVTSWSWSWDVFDHGTDAALIGYDGNNAVYRYEWWTNGNQKPCVRFVVCFLTANGVTYEGDVFPPKGTYAIQGAEAAGKVAKYQTQNSYDWVYNSSRWFSMVYNASNTQYKFFSGNVIFEEGATGPYIHTSSLKLMDSSANYYITSSEGTTSRSNQAGTFTITVGSAAVYRTVSVVSNDNTMGTTSYAMKSGYVYTNNITNWKNGSTWTLTATPNPGYRFVCWKKGSTQISTNDVTDVTIDGNATYTAYFEPLGGTQYTITVQAENDDYCTVSGGGTYYEGEEITISSVSKNEHLYIFDQFMLEGEDEDMGEPSFNIEVTGDATYTAIYRRAYDGTITATASSAIAGTATASPSGSLTGGTAVTLTAVANEGYTFTGWDDDNNGTIDNTDPTRTVYVDGSKAYTAKFVEGVTIDIQAAMTDNHGFGWGYCFYYWAKTYGYDIMIRGADNLVYTANADFGLSDINTSESFIKDHGTTVRFTAFDARFYNQDGKKVLEANAVGNNGKNYHLILRGHSGSYSDEQTEAYSQTYGSYAPEHDSENIYFFTTQNGSGGYYDVTWKSQIVFITDESLCGTIPSGIYQASDTWDDGTLLSDGYTYGNYKLNSSSFVYMPATGYAEVVNRDETYYVLVDGYNSAGYSFYQTIGTTPYSVTVSSNSNSYGSAGIVWHSSNCGDVAYGAGTQKFFSGNSITLTATPNSGYEFWRWSDEDSSVKTSAYGASRNVTVSGNLTLQAIFRVAVTKYIVTINTPEHGTLTVMDGETVVNSGDNVDEGTVLTVTTTPAADYHFGAWTNDGAASVTVNGAKTIGATFAQNDYFLNATYGAGGASVTRDDSGNNLTVKRAGNTVTLTPTAATGYNFLAWAGDDAAKMSGNVFTFPTNGTHNTTYNVQATFQANTYQVSFAAGEGSGTMTDQTFTYGVAQNLKANTFTAPTATATYNYNGATGGNSPASATVTATADGWIEGNNYYEEGAEVNNLTTTNGATVAMTANWGWYEEITLPTPTKTGYEFNQWSFNMGGMDLMEDAGAEIAIEEDVEMTALWNIVTYNLTYEGLEGATNTNPTSYNVESETITLAAPGARDGWTFTGWTISGTPVTEITHGSTGDKTLTANWTKSVTTYSVQFLAGEHGRSVSATAGGADISSGADVAEGTSVTLTAEPRNFYHFVAWMDGETTKSTEEEYTFTLSDNVNLTAVFARDETIILEDNHKTKAVDPAEEWYADYEYLREDLDGAKVNVLYKRTMNANTWCVFALPFDYSLRSPSSVLKGKVYELGEFIYTTTGMTLNFPPVGQRIEANRPYLFYSSGNDKTTDLVFNNVQLQPIANNSYSIDNSGEGNVGGRIIFNATTSYVRLDEGKDEDAKKKTIYLSGNRLYYLNLDNASWMRAFRGYFTLDAGLQYMPPRVRIVLEGQTATEVEVVTDTQDNSGNVRKYIENGVLVIEREGVRYDATGARRN